MNGWINDRDEVSGVDMYDFGNIARRVARRKVRCLIVIKYRIKIIIPEHEVFLDERYYGYHVLHSMCGARVNYVVTYIDREADLPWPRAKLPLKSFKK